MPSVAGAGSISWPGTKRSVKIGEVTRLSQERRRVYWHRVGGRFRHYIEACREAFKAGQTVTLPKISALPSGYRSPRVIFKEQRRDEQSKLPDCN